MGLMKNSSKQSKSQKQTANTKQAAETSRRVMGDGAEVEVLYQRMGEKWFAFSIVDEEVFIGEVPESAIQNKAPIA